MTSNGSCDVDVQTMAAAGAALTLKTDVVGTLCANRPGGPDQGCRTHRLETEPLVALPPPSLPFRAAVDDAAAGSMFWEAMSSGR